MPVTDGDLGDVYVNMALPARRAAAAAERRLVVPPVVAHAADRARRRTGRWPGRRSRRSFAVQVTDAAGQPVRASVSLAVIDEAVFGVKADDTPDPARVFYRREYRG